MQEMLLVSEQLGYEDTVIKLEKQWFNLPQEKKAILKSWNTEEIYINFLN